jgi:hypothetical protein
MCRIYYIRLLPHEAATMILLSLPSTQTGIRIRWSDIILPLQYKLSVRLLVLLPNFATLT